MNIEDVVRHLTARSTGNALSVFLEALDGTLPTDVPSTWHQRHKKTKKKKKKHSQHDQQQAKEDGGDLEEEPKRQLRVGCWTQTKQLPALPVSEVSALMALGALYSHTTNSQNDMVLTRASESPHPLRFWLTREHCRRGVGSTTISGTLGSVASYL